MTARRVWPAEGYTGRTRRRWLFWTQYEFMAKAWTGARWQNPWNMDRWPILPFWTYKPPAKASCSPALTAAPASALHDVDRAQSRGPVDGPQGAIRMFKITDVKSATGLMIAGYLRENGDHGEVEVTPETRNKALAEVLTAITSEVEDWADNLPSNHEARLAHRVAGLKPHEHAAEMFGLEGDDAIETFVRVLATETGTSGAELADAARRVAKTALVLLCTTLRYPEAEFPAAAASVVTDAAAAGFEITRGRFTPGGIYRGLEAGVAPGSDAPGTAGEAPDPLAPGSPTLARSAAVVDALRAIRLDLEEAGRGDDYGRHVNALIIEASTEG